MACPHSPDAVKPIRELSGLKVQQVAIGSCTNSSYADLAQVAKILRGKKVHEDVSLVISPGSRQVFEMLARDGILADLIASGARILESAWALVSVWDRLLLPGQFLCVLLTVILKDVPAQQMPGLFNGTEAAAAAAARG